MVSAKNRTTDFCPKTAADRSFGDLFARMRMADFAPCMARG